MWPYWIAQLMARGIQLRSISAGTGLFVGSAFVSRLIIFQSRTGGEAVWRIYDRLVAIARMTTRDGARLKHLVWEFGQAAEGQMVTFWVRNPRTGEAAHLAIEVAVDGHNVPTGKIKLNHLSGSADLASEAAGEFSDRLAREAGQLVAMGLEEISMTSTVSRFFGQLSHSLIEVP